MSEYSKNSYQRIVEIIVYLISELKSNKNFSDIDIMELRSRGYTHSEISTAFSWLADRIEFSEEIFFSENFSNINSFRILHDVERDMFTKDALGELIQMQALGLIDNENIESIIDKAISMGIRQLDSEQLKSFIALSILHVGDDIPGSRLLLNGNDSIN